MPRIPFDRDGLSMLVAVIGTTLSVYLYSWQSNEEVEEEIASGHRRLSDRRGATPEELRRTRWDVALGIVAVGFMSVPIMTTGAAYDVCQTLNWKHGLHMIPSQGRRFYGLIVLFTLVAMVMNFAGLNPMKALVWAGIVQGISTPPMMVVLMRLTNRRDVMGSSANGFAVNVLGWTTTVAVFAAAACLIAMWIWQA